MLPSNAAASAEPTCSGVKYPGAQLPQQKSEHAHWSVQGPLAPFSHILEMQLICMRFIAVFVCLFVKELELSSIADVLCLMRGQNGATVHWQVPCALCCGSCSALRVFRGLEREL